MKLSLSWIFDHLNVSWQDLDANELVKRVSATTAEIEHAEHIQTCFDDFTLARCGDLVNGQLLLESVELKKEFTLSPRTDAVKGLWYLIKRSGKDFHWATLADVGSSKEGFFPALSCFDDELKGGWKKRAESEDMIWHIDNKAVTHRADLWGHRGFAREIAALYGLKLKSEEQILEAVPVKHYEVSVPHGKDFPCALSVQMTETCKRFAALAIDSIINKPSDIGIALRLARIDAKPIDAVVDATNYVMYDLSQPMHAFDAQNIRGNYLTARAACEGEKLTLLDGTTVTLTSADCVISDDTKPLALAGVMGGKESGVTASTHKIVAESAHFSATNIRRTAARYKKRTEASARFEKTLDPMQNTQALQRFVRVLRDLKVEFSGLTSIVSLGPVIENRTIKIAHELLVSRLGVFLTPDQIDNTLTALGFGIRHSNEQGKLVYLVTVPSFRGAKDVTIKEDLVEEVGRFVGYGTIPATMPMRQMRAISHQTALRIRAIKELCAFGIGLREVYTYPFYEDAWLRELGYDPVDTICVANPLSQEASRLATSLVPGLVAVVKRNLHKEDLMGFFEWGRIWSKVTGVATERKTLSGIVFGYKQKLDFYEYKIHIQKLFAHLGMIVEWVPAHTNFAPWYTPYQTAHLMFAGAQIGTVGMMHPTFISKLGEGSAFIFELDGDGLLAYSYPENKFHQIVRYQATHVDISMLAPYTITVADLEHALAQTDARIVDVILRDMFEKPEWGDKRSITLRVTLQDEHKTMTREEIEELTHAITQAVIQLGVTLR